MKTRLMFALAASMTLGLAVSAHAQDEAAASPGQALYEAECVRCHNDNGDGNTRMGLRYEVKPFAADHFAEIGADGVRDAIVNGRENMDPIEGADSAAIDALVEYTMSLAN